MELDEVMKVLAAFERERVEYILVGGVAMNFHGLIRADRFDAEALRQKFGLED